MNLQASLSRVCAEYERITGKEGRTERPLDLARAFTQAVQARKVERLRTVFTKRTSALDDFARADPLTRLSIIMAVYEDTALAGKLLGRTDMWLGEAAMDLAAHLRKKEVALAEHLTEALFRETATRSQAWIVLCTEPAIVTQSPKLLSLRLLPLASRNVQEAFERYVLQAISIIVSDEDIQSFVQSTPLGRVEGGLHLCLLLQGLRPHHGELLSEVCHPEAYAFAVRVLNEAHTRTRTE